MFEDSMNTLVFLSKYIPLALPANTLPGWNNALEIMNRKETPYKKSADILCKNLRRGGDEISNMLAAGFEDERTLYKKLNRSRLLFASALYDFALFANK